MLQRLKRTFWRAGLLATIFSLLGTMVALAASGALDGTFGGSGKQTTDFASSWDDRLYAIALQSDGKIVAAGLRSDPAAPAAATRDFAVARYDNGNLDLTFSGDGKRLTDFGARDEAYDVAIQSDGKIVVSGETCMTTAPWDCDLAVARYTTHGNPDTSFSGDGKQVVSYGSGDNGSTGGLAIQADGKIVIAGFMFNNNGDYDLAVYRLNDDGSPDSTFSGDGKQRFSFGSGRQESASDVLVSGNKIVVAGTICDGTGFACNFAVARLTSGGALDSTFSGDGKQVTNFGGEDHAYGLALQPDDRIVVAGEKYAGGLDHFFALARYNTNGTPDLTFSGDGKQTVRFGDDARAKAVLVQADGKIVVAGTGRGSASFDFAMARLNPGGGLDSTFSGNGKANFDFGGNQDSGYALVLQGDDKYVLGGYTDTGPQDDFALLRVLP